MKSSQAKNPSMAPSQAEGSIFPVTCPYQLVLLPHTPLSCFPALLRPTDVSEPRSPSYFKLFLTLFPLAWSLYLSSTWLFISYSSFHIFSTIISSEKPFLISQISSDHCFMLWSTFIFDFRAFITVCNSIYMYAMIWLLFDSLTTTWFNGTFCDNGNLL